MTELIRPLTLQGSCLPFSNQDHGLGLTALPKWGLIFTLVLWIFGESWERTKGA